MRIDPHFRFEQPCGSPAPLVIRVRSTCRFGMRVALHIVAGPCKAMPGCSFLKTPCERAVALLTKVPPMRRWAGVKSHSLMHLKIDAGLC